MALSLSSPSAATGARLRIRREDLFFQPAAGGRTRFEFLVRNEGTARSAPERAIVSFAPFGAFVAGSTLSRARIPEIEAGGEVRITLLYEEDYLRMQAEVLASMLATRLAERGIANAAAEISYAGNFDVFVRRDVGAERHRGMVGRVRAGVLNHACFQVGTGVGAYKFELETLPEAWSASIALFGAGEVGWGEWIRGDGATNVLLKFRPPSDAPGGSLVVEVTRMADGRSACVEFDLPAPR